MGVVYLLELTALVQRSDPGHLAQNKEARPEAMQQGTRCPMSCLPVSGRCNLGLPDRLCWRTGYHMGWGAGRDDLQGLLQFCFQFSYPLWVLTGQKLL